jgi:signal transduction histidine kinase
MDAPAEESCRQFTPAIVDPPERTAAGIRGFDWFVFAAIATWIACGLWPISEMITGRFRGLPALVYGIAFVSYGAALVAVLRLPNTRKRLPPAVPIGLAGIEAVAAMAVNLDTAWYLSGTGVGVGLLVIVAAQLPYFLSARITWVWIFVQTTAMIWGVGGFMPGSLVAGVTFLAAALGFQVFAAASSMLAISEGQARSNLARTNAELTATRELLAEASRTSERLRISRDLHDTLGHHLTALSLQLDVASRMSEGKAADHIRQAHAITKLLLSDVRDVVSTLRESSKLNLAEAIRALTMQPAGVRVHLDVPETLVVEEPGRAEAILRAVQEILTNTARHARAANLWIRVEAAPDGVAVDARDDGHGAQRVTWGNGLRGMRERFEQHGGHVDITPGAGAGFRIRAFMPLSAAA